MATQKELAAFIQLQPDSVAPGLMVVPTQDLLGPLLHVSTNSRIKVFTPSVTDRTGNKENRSVPRISVAPSLMGCLIGYVAGWSDFFYPNENKKGKLLQDLTVYAFDTPFAIKPSVKLLFDQKQSDEHWLVGYSKDTLTYTPRKVAEFFYKDVLLVGRPDKHPFKIVTILINVQVESLVFSKNITLTKGFWQLRGPEPSFNGVKDWTDDKHFKLTKIDRATYDYIPHKEYLSLEDFEQPAYMRW